MAHDTSFICGSRAQSPVAANVFPGPDGWRVMPNGDRTCSFCGSLHPDDFLACVEEAAEPDGKARVSATTKRYKFYARHAEINNAAEGGIKFYTWHLPDQAFTDRVNAVLPAAIKATWGRMFPDAASPQEMPTDIG